MCHRKLWRIVLEGYGNNASTIINRDYQETQIAADAKGNVVIELHNGTFFKGTRSSDHVLNIEFMPTPLLYTITTRAGTEEAIDLAQRKVYRDAADPQAAVE